MQSSTDAPLSNCQILWLALFCSCEEWFLLPSRVQEPVCHTLARDGLLHQLHQAWLRSGHVPGPDSYQTQAKFLLINPVVDYLFFPEHTARIPTAHKRYLCALWQFIILILHPACLVSMLYSICWHLNSPWYIPFFQYMHQGGAMCHSIIRAAARPRGPVLCFHAYIWAAGYLEASFSPLNTYSRMRTAPLKNTLHHKSRLEHAKVI